MAAHGQTITTDEAVEMMDGYYQRGPQLGSLSALGAGGGAGGVGGGGREERRPLLPAPAPDVAQLAEQAHTYYASLANSPQAALINLIMRYHQALLAAGHTKEADAIAKSLASLQQPSSLSAPAGELHGMDLLLKDGLLDFLLKLNPHLPSIPRQVVRFRDVSYSAKVTMVEGFDTMGSKLLDCFKLSRLSGRTTRTETVPILSRVSGFVMPGTMTLLLGPPGSGKSTLLRCLAGCPLRGSGVTVGGEVRYNATDIKELNMARFAAYVPQTDDHLPLLTVRETLQFARQLLLWWTLATFSEGYKDVLKDAISEGQDPKLEVTMAIQGLKRVADRLVGNAMIPTLTEGERHRLTTAEFMAGAHSVYYLDQINAAMEPGTLFDECQAIKVFMRVRQLGCIISLSQPSAETFELFDRVIVLDRGQVVYQGPREDVLPYFAELGYVKPPMLEVAEFLSEITTPEGVRFLGAGQPVKSLGEFVAAYERSAQHAEVARVLNAPRTPLSVTVQLPRPLGLKVEDVDVKGREGQQVVVSAISDGGSIASATLAKSGDVLVGDRVTAVAVGSERPHFLEAEGLSAAEVHKLVEEGEDPVRLRFERELPVEPIVNPQFHRKYIREPWAEFKLLLWRQLLTQSRNKIMLGSRAFSVGIMSLFVGTLFFQMSDHPDSLNMNLRRGVGFLSLIVNTLGALGQMPSLMEERKVFYKQHNAGFFRVYNYVLAQFVGTALFAMVEATVWSILVYFLTGLTLKDGGYHFWVYYGIVSIVVLHGSSFIRFIACFAPDMQAGTAMSGVLIATMVLFAGFVCPRFLIPDYWIWMYYLNPMQWGITALLINEFQSGSYSELCRDVFNPAAASVNPFCIGRLDQSVGQAYLGRGQFLIDRGWIGVAAGVITAWTVVWNLLAYVALCRVRHVDMPVRRVLPAQRSKRGSFTFTRSLKGDLEKSEGGSSALKLPVLSVTLSWHDLSYDVLIPGLNQVKPVLSNISGWVRSGELLAVVGTAASSRTTLLNCLAGRRVDPQHISGQILVNGFPKAQATFARVMSFMGKPEDYPAYLTVREAVYMSALLRLPGNVGNGTVGAYVEEVLDYLELQGVATGLGHTLTRASSLAATGRRYMLACELAANPSVLFLEDPLAGLDAPAARAVLHSLQTVASQGRAVIASVGTLTASQLSSFSRALVLRTGGDPVYFGAVGQGARDIVAYFESVPGTPRCGEDHNPATYMMDVIGDGSTAQKAVRDYAFEFRVSDLAISNMVELQRLRRSKGEAGPELLERGMAASWPRQFGLVFLSLQRYYYRNISYSWGRIMSVLIMGLLLGSVFWQIKYDTNPGLGARGGFLYVTLILLGIGNATGIVPQIAAMLPAYRHNLYQKKFTAAAFNISLGLAELPWLMLSTLLFCSIALPMTGIATDSVAHFFRFWFILLEYVLAITYFGLFLTLAMPVPQLASVVIPLVISMWIATAGLVIPFRKIPQTYIWLFWTNPLQYALDALTNLVFFCDTAAPECTNGGTNMACLVSPAACPLCKCERLKDARDTFSWNTIQYNRSFDHARIPIDMLALFGFIVLFRFAALFALRFFRHHRV